MATPGDFSGQSSRLHLLLPRARARKRAARRLVCLRPSRPFPTIIVHTRRSEDLRQQYPWPILCGYNSRTDQRLPARPPRHDIADLVALLWPAIRCRMGTDTNVPMPDLSSRKLLCASPCTSPLLSRSRKSSSKGSDGLPVHHAKHVITALCRSLTRLRHCDRRSEQFSPPDPPHRPALVGKYIAPRFPPTSSQKK
jgi:hypothetical protein